MNPTTFSLSDLLTPLLKKALQKPLQKAVTWAYDQADGKTHGEAVQAENTPVIAAVEDFATGTLAQSALKQIGAAHVTNDKIAAALGIPTTEEGLLAAGIGHAGTLNLSDPAAALSFLAANIVK